MLLPKTRRNPLLIPFLFLALGFGLLGWYGLSWYELPRYSESEIETSVEANLAMDLARLGPSMQLDAQRMTQLRTQIRAEVMADIQRERAESERGLGVGLICIVVGLGHAVLMRGLAKPSA